jgi:hypothetical protein
MQPVTISPYYINGNSVSIYEFSPKEQLSTITVVNYGLAVFFGGLFYIAALTPDCSTSSRCMTGKL